MREAEIYDVLRAVYVNVPYSVRNRGADADHSDAVDDVEFGSALHILEQRLERVHIRDVAFKHIGPSGQMLRGLLAGQHEGADAPAITHKLPDNGAAQVSGRAGDDVEFAAYILIHEKRPPLDSCLVPLGTVMSITEGCLNICF